MCGHREDAEEVSQDGNPALDRNLHGWRIGQRVVDQARLHRAQYAGFMPRIEIRHGELDVERSQPGRLCGLFGRHAHLQVLDGKAARDGFEPDVAKMVNDDFH